MFSYVASSSLFPRPKVLYLIYDISCSPAFIPEQVVPSFQSETFFLNSYNYMCKFNYNATQSKLRTFTQHSY